MGWRHTLGTADGSGVNGRLAYDLGNGLTLGGNLSYDKAFDTRFSGNIHYRFANNSAVTKSEKKVWKTPVIQALSEAVKNRDVRVHDAKVVARNVEITQGCTTKTVRILGKKKSLRTCYTTTTTVTQHTYTVDWEPILDQRPDSPLLTN